MDSRFHGNDNHVICHSRPHENGESGNPKELIRLTTRFKGGKRNAETNCNTEYYVTMWTYLLEYVIGRTN